MADLESGSTVSGFPIIHEGNITDLINFYDNIDDVVLKPYLENNYARVYYDVVGANPKDGDLLVEEGPKVSVFADSWKEIYPGSIADLISDIRSLIPDVINSVTSTETSSAGSADAVRRAYEKGVEALDYAKNISIPTIPDIPSVIDSVSSSNKSDAGSANSVRIAYQKGVEALNFAKNISVPTIPTIPDKVNVINSVTSTNTNAAGSAAAVKKAYDKAVEAKNAAENSAVESNSWAGSQGGADDGWLKLPGGVMIQWMSVFLQNYFTTINFPRPFSERVYTVQMSRKTHHYGVIETDTLIPNDWDITNNKSSIRVWSDKTGDSSGSWKPTHVFVMVIGK